MECKPYPQICSKLSCLLALALAIISYNWRILMKKLCQFRLRPRPRPRPRPLPPGPKGFPIIGCLPTMVKNNIPTFKWMHQFMKRMETEIGCFHLGNTYFITVTSPELTCEFLKKHDAIFASRPKVMSSRLINNGHISTAFSPAGDQWKKMKKILVSKVLSPSMHEKFHDKRRGEADRLVRYVHSQCRSELNDGIVDVRSVARHYCAGVIKRYIFDKRSFGKDEKDGSPAIEDVEHMEATFILLSHLYGFAIGDLCPWLEVFDFDGHKKIMTDAIAVIDKFHDVEINRRVEIWKKGIEIGEEDILGVLINLKDSQNNPLLTIQEIKAHIKDIILATTDNPSNVAEWSLAEMINQPKIFDKARQELDRVVGRDRLVEESDLPNLNYIKACAKESFRLHPIAPFNVPHESSKDVVVGGYFIPKGSQVLISRRGVGHNPRVWEEPLKYKPERHISRDEDTGEVMISDHELRMFSFSTGRRGCPGFMLGSTLTTMLLARLIQGFDWNAPNGPEFIDLGAPDDDNFLMKRPLLARATPRNRILILYCIFRLCFFYCFFFFLRTTFKKNKYTTHIYYFYIFYKIICSSHKKNYF
ncbi:isoleucine N-monooxygenase 1-like isoform X2 [Andrographis paniculata]|uniref:isoleucine N-monooxygenase 1-like isoform X2 n=1 Tax=Andrographis paniculata TaxID=175694 RepID=UPI0021E7EF29|nr:isoleucine N-monooxygenase 1-like isoform X2 [Andrographis paniculata]